NPIFFQNRISTIPIKDNIMATLKIFILAVIFVATSGALFSEFFKEHKFLTFLASIMAIIASFYLIQDIYIDLKKGASIESEELQKQIADLQNRLDNKKYSEPIKNEPIRNESIPDEPTVKETLSAGNVFRDRLQDGSLAHEMVVIPAGRFRMGDIQGGGASDEKPVHRVSIKQFAMGKYEVTFAEYDKFAQAKGREKPNDQGWGRDNRPVINVSWDDAVAYAEWLSQQTGKQYRLPTEAEWEYAARAKTTTSRYWGNNPDDACRYANVADKSAKEKFSNWAIHNCTDGYVYTASVGSFKSNDFDLFDMLGNVWEWTCSEYESEYSGKEKQCISENRARQPVIRGGSWSNIPRGVRAAYRIRYSHGNRDDNVGFRIAR
ncbi:formylglycine-generating enzyme family protein, partial [Candidatus Marithioploca araucensis]|nr:formylglycine-generating enzyme family protein [Candidatus Marithioploca araucensis]